MARAAGVSAITVSRYFNQPESVSPERRERIAEVVAELGYVPNLVAGGLASARGRIVGMVIPNISGPIFANTYGWYRVSSPYGTGWVAGDFLQ